MSETAPVSNVILAEAQLAALSTDAAAVVFLEDYKVPFKREATLADSALRCRQRAQNENFSTFNIIDFVERFLPGILAVLNKGPLHFDFFDANEGQKPAFVTYKPLTLHIDREIWELARDGEPEARFIVAHEIGHIVHHDHYAQAFSGVRDGLAKYAQKEERAEWQANTFASHFLLPAHILEAHLNADVLVQRCDIPKEMAEERVAAAEEDRRRAARCARAKGYLGDACVRCGNFSIVPSGNNMICDTCGHTRSI